MVPRCAAVIVRRIFDEYATAGVGCSASTVAAQLSSASSDA